MAVVLAARGGWPGRRHAVLSRTSWVNATEALSCSSKRIARSSGAVPTTRCSSHVDQQAATRQIRRPSTARAGKPPPAVQRLRCDLGATRVQRAALERSAPAREKAKGRHRSNRRQVDSFDPMKLNAGIGPFWVSEIFLYRRIRWSNLGFKHQILTP